MRASGWVECVKPRNFVVLMVAAVCAAQESGERWHPSLTLQTGLSSTFQLTLGGAYGLGPAWQNRATLEFDNVVRSGDTAMLTYWTTMDTRSLQRNWLAGVSYRFKGVSRPGHTWSTSVGYQRWMFPSVLCGANDHLLAINSVYRTRVKLPVSVTVDNWTALRTPLGRGNLTHVQGAVTHTLWKGRGMRLVGKHGPSTTYSWKFYARPGWRVLRYGGGLVLESRNWSLEAMAREQAGIAPRVPDVTYWSVLLSRRW